MGYAIAEAAASLGAEVTLMQRATALTPAPQAHFVYVTSAAEMATAVKAHVAAATISSASPPSPTTRRSRLDAQAQEGAEPMELKLKPTEDILAYVARSPTARSASASPPRARTSPTTRRPSARARRSR
jgi:phosphopantothenoylcysteine decarboxylase/phosphopantothenate--cysteine ligase